MNETVLFEIDETTVNEDGSLVIVLSWVDDDVQPEDEAC